VLTIRCTSKLLKWLDAEVPPESISPTNRLGDWYANLLFTKHRRLIICVSERSLLPIFVEARDFSFIRARFQERVRSVLRSMGAGSDALHSEAPQIAEIKIGKTASRRVLGSLNDLAYLARFKIEEHPEIDLTTLAIELAETPCSPLKYQNPRVVSLELLRRMHS
jgi:hypothetical protein